MCIAVTEDCTIDFGLYLVNKSVYAGIDIALYKAKESDSPVDYYFMFIIYKTAEYAGVIVSSRVLPTQCSGWQVFHLEDKIFNLLENGYNPFQLRFAVYTAEYRPLNCQEIAHLFLLTSSLDHDNDGEATEPGADSSGDTNIVAEGNNSTSNQFLLPENKLIDYIPALTFFYDEPMQERNDEVLG